MLAAISLVRDARWMTPARAIAYRNVLLAIVPLGAVVWTALSRNGIDLQGSPIGTDFVSFWTASQIALSGYPSDAYNVTLHWAAQKTLFHDQPVRYSAFFYPPVFLLICLPLALLPYFWSLACWLGATGYVCWMAVNRLSGRAGMALSILAFPAVFINAMHGQNGFLTTALFAGAVLALERQPTIAGILFGSLVYKPHLLVMVPFALIASRRWMTAAAAAGTAAALCGGSLAVFGLESWRAFVSNTPLARAALEQGLVGNEKMQSAFGAVRLFGGTVEVAYFAQIVTAVAAGSFLIYLCKVIPVREGLGVATTVATLLATPFLLPYDLMLLAIPLVWVMKESRETGFLPWEKSALMTAFALPLISVTAALYLRIPIAPLVIIGLYAVIVRRILQFCRPEHGGNRESQN